ncbi:hypothetical protein N7535_003293 [Penicillium sp. DV-2018c]|nr:hypothetical protein N7535_003293 [Penicillium sp. DV-2018c]
MMTRAAPPLLLQLQSAETASTQVKTLRALKNALIGHDQKKEAYIAAGIIPALAQVLTTRWPGTVEFDESRSEHDRSTQRDPDSLEACLQATWIVNSLAQGGPTFLTPLFASNILPSLLTILSSSDCPVSFGLPILRLVNTIADRLPLQSQEQWPRDTQLADLVFAPANITSLRRIISQEYKDLRSQTAIELAAALIGKLCTEETHKTALAELGVLDALALKIASFVVSKGFVLPGAEAHLKEPGALEALPSPAPESAKLAPILRAVAVIIEQSKWRAEHFLSSPGIVTVFPKQVPGFAPSDIKKGPWGSTYLSGSAVPRERGGNPMDQLLPSVPLAHTKSSSSSANFPPLGHGGSQRRPNHSYPTPFSLPETPMPEDDENAVIPWLLCMIRSESGMVRLMSARLVTVLFRLGLAKKHRILMLSYLVIPILVRMLEKDFRLPDEEGANYDGLLSPTQRLKEEAPAVLAHLVVDDQELQKHAVEGDALKRLSQLLKETYNPITEQSRPMWHAEDAPARDLESLPQECRLGPSGYSPTLCHVMRYRENILKALAALVPFKDEYRKAICEHGVVPYIIDALKPRPSDAPAGSMPNNTASDGNPTPTILAACGVARMLTRSVSVLRTSLIDAGVAQPLFALLRHSDIEVQTAATAAICNLALDFSPMKEAIISSNVVPILCEHAHSPNTKLQIESLWALKHMVYDTANNVRMEIIDNLGPKWILEVIAQDPLRAVRRGIDEESDQGSGFAMGRSNSAGEQVDILNPVPDAAKWDEDLKMTDTMPPSKMSLDMFLPDARRRRKLALYGTLAQTTQSRQDDIAVQEQTFDLLRNMVCGRDATEMIDYLFKKLGEDDFLDTLAATLKPRTIQMPHRRDPGTQTTQTLHVPNEIISSATSLIIHLAAGHPRHRNLIAWHRDLLPSIANYFNHSSKDIRSACVWVVINLIYEEDQNDYNGCRDRAFRVRSLGLAERLASLEDDVELDTKERTKTALHLLNKLARV